MSGELVLLVDDEAHITELAQLYLEKEGFSTFSVHDGEAALKAVEEKSPALMVLDLMLPKLDGYEICRQLRGKQNPIFILMLTARDEDVDKIVGLELGADDYLTKPFNPRELVARVKALLRRGTRQNEKLPEKIGLGNFKLNRLAREVFVGGSPVALRTQEFELLVVMLENRSIVLSREKLLNLAWGYDFFGQTRTVDVHVGALRKKLAGADIKIETITGVGYKLVANV